MRSLLALSAALIGGLLQVSNAFSQSGVVDERLVRARNVAIGFDSGAGFGRNPPTSEDRDALYAVRREVEQSGRYWVVSNRKDADLLIAIRTRWVSDSQGPRPVRRDGLAFRGEGPPRADVLSVYDARYSQSGVPLWRGVLVGGLSGDRPPLLARFQADVDKLAQRP